MVPVGNIPSRSRWARKRASVSSPLCLSPALLLDRCRMGQVHRKTRILRPSTSQYQLKVDSTTTPANSACHGF
jgi:hypothetical protein